MTGGGQRNDALFPGVGINDETLESRRDDFVVFGEKKNCGRMTRARVGDAVEIARNFLGHWSGEQPEVPPAKLAEDDLAQGRGIVQNQTCDFAMGGDVERAGSAEARTKNDDPAVGCDLLQ